MPSRRRPLAVALLSLILFGLLGSQASAAEPPEPQVYYSSFGPDGTEATDFQHVWSVAVDPQAGAVYVLDAEFGEPGALYKFDEEGHPLDFTGTAPNIDANKIEGIAVSEGLSAPQVAVDPSSHVVYVTEKNAIRAFEADGEAHEFSAGPGAGTDKIPGFGVGESFSAEVFGVAVDANGAIYASDSSTGDVYIFASTGEPIVKFTAPGIETLGNLGVASNGVVYVNRGGAGVATFRVVPSAFPVTASTTYSNSGELSSGGGFAIPSGIAIDLLSDDVYVLRTFSGSYWIDQFDKAGAFLRSLGKEGEAGFAPFMAGLAANGATRKLFAGSSDFVTDTSKVRIFGPPIYLPAAPSVESTTALNVTADSAKLRAKINPNTLATTYRFEYGLEDCSVATCTTVTPPSPDIGSGHKGVFAFAQLTGLAAGTTYHFRVIAENSLDTTVGPDRTFTTQLSALGFQLADSRVWEMVSPPNKHGGKLSFVQDDSVVRAAADGEGLAYPSYGSIEAEPEGSPTPNQSQVLARRGADGWHSKDIVPPSGEATGVTPREYELFTADLSRALLRSRSQTPLSPQADERTLYLRENTEPATYTPLLTNKEGFANVPSGAKFGNSDIFFEGSNPQLTHIAFRSQASLIAGAQENSVYMWADGQISPVSEMPAGEGGETVKAMVGSGAGSVRGAVSSDGSRVFWSPGNGYNVSGISLPALYLRDTKAEETVRLDAVQSGPGFGEAHPAFHGASADGTVVYFTDSQQLTEDASPEGRDLYRCEIPAGESASGCATLTDVSAPLAGSGESAKVREMSPALSEDGSRFYFVAEGKLDAQPNERGESAVPGEPNLYLAEEGAGTRFIATLSKGDEPDWALGGPSRVGYGANLSAAASPSGRYLSFMSQRSLSGYDNQDAASGEPDEEIFRYDALSEELDCLSCNPSGASPVGERLGVAGTAIADRRGLWAEKWVAATLPEIWGPNAAGADIAVTQPRAVLENGRVFFNAVDSLVPADSNGQWDVYQYEPLGVGDCSASSGGPAVSRSGEGCVSLISSGSAEEEAVFIDSSTSGDSAFFLSSAKLSVLDEDTVQDIYVARVNGVPGKLTPRTECLGEACLPVPQAPNDPTPASASFSGGGNVASERCPKGKRRQLRNNGSSRCVAQRKHKKKHRKAKRAANKRRAGR